MLSTIVKLFIYSFNTTMISLLVLCNIITNVILSLTSTLRQKYTEYIQNFSYKTNQRFICEAL